MSVMLSSVSASFYQMAGALPVSATSATSAQPAAAVKPADHDDDHRPRFRENTLVNAMMAAFQALGIGPAAASPAAATATPAASATTAATAATSSPASTSTVPMATSTATATTTPAADATPGTTATTSTDAAPAADTLEKAVNEFAHALYSMLHRQGRSEHSESDHGGEHGHSHEGRRNGGYNSFVQRLERLAQSLGTAPAAASDASAASGTATTTPVAQTMESPATTATTSAVPSTDMASATPTRGVTRLLAAFSKVLSLLQPPSATPVATTTAPADAATTATTGTATSTADKLKLFLTTLAQSLHSGAAATPPSPVGSRVNLTA
jgi:hypothetical protein